MRKLFVTATAIIFLAGCTNTSQTTTTKSDSTQMVSSPAAIDTVKARQDLNAMADDIHSAFKKKDAGFVDKYMTADGIYMGTDPNEIWSMDNFKTNIESQYKDTAFRISDYKIARREIRFHGPSAIIIEQFMIPEMVKNVMIRSISHARYENGKWMLDMYSWNLIPKNEDIPKISKAL